MGESFAAAERAGNNPPGTPGLAQSYPLQRVVALAKDSSGRDVQELACGHRLHAYADYLVAKRRRCTFCPPRQLQADSPLVDRERRLAEQTAAEKVAHAAWEEADKRPCIICGTPAKAQGSFYGGPALCDPCLVIWERGLRKHPKQLVVAVEMEAGQEDWWAVQWWHVTLACGHVELTQTHDPGWPWLHCWQCPIP